MRHFLVGLFALFLASFPSSSHAEVRKQQRDLLIVSHLDVRGAPHWNGLYTFLETSGINIIRGELGRHYRKVHAMRSSPQRNTRRLTLARVAKKLKEIAATRSVKAVDLFWMTHGSPEIIHLQHNNRRKRDQALHVKDKVAPAILAKLNKSERAKLRAVFSTACYGKSHLDGWLKAGFQVASGSRQIFADADESLPPFLRNWRKGRRFRSAVHIANRNQKRDTRDRHVRTMKRFKNMRVDSHREVKGKTCLRIDSRPSHKCK